VILLVGGQVVGQDIDNGVLDCGDEMCQVRCNYGYIPTGDYFVTVDQASDASCVTPVGLIVGGYNQDWNHEDVFLASAELYSIVGPSKCNYTLPDLPVGMKGMFGGWVGGKAVICGGEDQAGSISQFCFYYNPVENSWVLNVMMETGRSFAATEVVDGCLVITGGQTMTGVTDTVEVIGESSTCTNLRDILLPNPRKGHCLVRAGDDLVMVGGGPDNYGSTQIYNLVTGSWRDGAPPQKDRALHDCSPLELEDGEMAVVVAGNDFSPMDLAEIYFPRNDTWIWTDGWMKDERTAGAMTVLGGRPTIFSGYGGDYCCKEYYVTAESFDLNSGNWWTLHARNMTEGRKSLAVVSVPSTMFSGCS